MKFLLWMSYRKKKKKKNTNKDDWEDRAQQNMIYSRNGYTWNTNVKTTNHHSSTKNNMMKRENDMNGDGWCSYLSWASNWGQCLRMMTGGCMAWREWRGEERRREGLWKGWVGRRTRAPPHQIPSCQENMTYTQIHTHISRQPHSWSVRVFTYMWEWISDDSICAWFFFSLVRSVKGATGGQKRKKKHGRKKKKKSWKMLTKKKTKNTHMLIQWAKPNTGETKRWTMSKATGTGLWGDGRLADGSRHIDF